MSAKRSHDKTGPDALSIGVDLGGTHILAVLVSAAGTIFARSEVRLSAEDRGSQEYIGSMLSRCVIEVWCHARDEFPHCLPLKGIGVAVPGNVDPQNGLARYLPNFGWLKPVNLAALVLDRIAAPASSSKTVRELLQVGHLHMRNDGRCAALAERHFGAGASGKHQVIAMLTLGTGIGGALIHDPSSAMRGRLFEGCTYDAGDFGHHVVRSGADAFQCVCGNRGCFECHASAAGLVRHWRKQGGDETAISLDDARSVIMRMRAGENKALAAFAAFHADLAAGLANLVTFYNPSLIVLGGGLARTPELYDGLVQAVDASTLPATRGKCAIVQSQLGGECAATGAGWLVFAEASGPPGVVMPTTTAMPPPAGWGTHGVIVSVGLTCIDTTMWVPAAPPVDSKTVAQRSLTAGGGNAANSAVAASRLRAPADPPVRLLSKVGPDAHGDAVLSELARDRVELQWVVRAPAGHATPASVILVHGQSRTIVHEPGLTNTSPLVPADLDAIAADGTGGGTDGDVSGGDTSRPAWLAGATLLHLDGRHPAAALHAAQHARAVGVRILLDVERPRDGLDKLLPLASYIVSSADFAPKLHAERRDAAPLGDAPEARAAYVLERCQSATWVAVTCGAAGAVVAERVGGGKVAYLSAPAWPLPADVRVRDTTGAGDAFIGAVAVGLRNGLPLRDVLRLASYVAAQNVCTDGARGGMPTYAALPAELRTLVDGKQ